MKTTESGRVPSAPGSREPSPQAVSAASGFDPSRVGLLGIQWERLRQVEEALANDAHFADDPECHPLYPQAVAARQVLEEIFVAQAELIRDAWGALNFILAFYEPGQRYLDTEAWKCAEARGRAVHARLGEWKDAASAMSAFGQDPKGLEAKPASAVPAQPGDAQ